MLLKWVTNSGQSKKSEGLLHAIQNRSDPFEVCHLSVQNTVRLLCVAPVCQHGKVFTSTETEDEHFEADRVPKTGPQKDQMTE